MEVKNLNCLLSILTVAVFDLSGCQLEQVPAPTVDLFPEADKMINDNLVLESTVSLIFSDCPLDMAAKQLSSAGGLSLAVPSDASALKVNGAFKNQPVDLVVDSIARSLDLKVRWISDNFVSLYRSDADETLTLVVPAPFFTNEQLPTCESLNISFHGGYLLATGQRDKIRDFIKNIQYLNRRLNVSFGVDLVLVRVSQRVYLDAAAELNLKSVNVLSITDVRDLINIFARLDAHFNKSKQVINAFCYLTEGQKTSLEVGTVRQRELKHISSEGYVSTSGYQEFKDGLLVDLICQSLSDSVYTLSATITNSKYRDSSDSSDVLPINDTSKLTSSKVILTDNNF